MKQSKSVKKSGPYHVTSHSQGRGIVYFMIYPAFPEYNTIDFKWAESRYDGGGGGPSIFTSIATARELESFLNSVYGEEQIEDWKNRIKRILDDESKSFTIAECQNCGILTGIKNEYIYCPVCGNKYKKE